jgi:PAS domain S-box-containing protein
MRTGLFGGEGTVIRGLLLLLVRIGLLAVVYFGAGRLGLHLAVLPGNVSVLWPPTGIALAALLTFGLRLWPGVALGAFVVGISTGVAPEVAAGMAVGNTLEALVGAALLRRPLPDRFSLDGLPEFLALIGLGAVLSPILSAGMGVASLCLGGAVPWSSFPWLSTSWWLGDALGAVILVPALLAPGKADTARGERAACPGAWLAEGVALLVLLLGVSLVVFGRSYGANTARVPLGYLVFPGVIWAALRFGPRGTALASLVVAVIAVAATSRSLGPFVDDNPREALLHLQTFLVVVSVTGLLLATVVTSRDRVERLLRLSHATLEEQVAERTQALGLANERLLTEADERQQAADELARSRRLFERIAEATPDLLYVFDLEQGRKVYANRDLTSALGHDAEHVFDVGDPFLRTLAHPEDLPQLEECARRLEVLADGEVLNHEYRLLHADGTYRWLRNRAVVFSRGEEGRAAQVLGVVQDITDRREAAEALCRSETRYRELVEQSPLSVQVLAPDGRLLQVNRAWERLWGVTLAEIPHYNLLQDEQLIECGAMPFIQRAFAGEAVGIPPGAYVPDHGLHTGRERWVRTVLYPVKDENDRLQEVVLIQEDITDQRRAEEGLRQSEERLRLATEAARMVAWEWNLGTGEVSRSLNAGDILGRGPEIVTGSGDEFLDLIHRDDRDRVQARLELALLNGSGYDQEFRIVWADGTVRWMHDRARVRRDAAGQAVRLTGIMWDVTERVKAEEALRVSRERLDLAVNSTELGLWYCDLPFDRLVWNDKCKEHFGLPPDAEVTIDLFYERLHPDDRERTRQAVDRALTERVGYDVEYRTVEPVQPGRPGRKGRPAVAGTPERIRWIRAIGRAFYDVSGRPVRFDGVTVDITRQKEAEEALREADRQKNEFLAMLAHELRNPLAPIRNGLEVIRLAGDDAEALCEVRGMMERQIEHLVRLVDDLLDVSRIIRSKITLREEPLELATVLARAVETARPVIDAHHHRLTISLPEKPLRLKGDLVRLAQVFSNLLNNAAKYTEPGGDLRLEAETENGEVIVRVGDTGVGMAPEMLRAVFDLFFQADHSAARSTGGLGIGLTLVKQLVEMHGGKVEAHSAGPGQGSTFIVRLPALAETAAIPGKDTPLSRTPDAPASRRVLVIDDNVDSARSLSLLLRASGHEVATAGDGPSGVEAARTFRPEVVLLDIGLPGMNGYEVARHLRGEDGLSGLLLVALTGYGQDEDRQRSREAGFDEHLVKPVDPRLLLEMVTEQDRAPGLQK